MKGSTLLRLGALIVGMLALLIGFAVLTLAALNLRGEDKLPAIPHDFDSSPAQIERGRYLALAGNCAGCHTPRGGPDYAGGVGIQTPFGTVYSSNLTPDHDTGLGGWSVDHFWRALHNGRAKDGRLLYPAFPYPSFTRVTREDADALYAYLRSLPPVRRQNLPHALRFPYDSQAALATWRALSFQPGPFVPDPYRSDEWNRGAYLVEGLGHCIACHGPRNVLGATKATEAQGGLSGGVIPVENWYAPALTAPREAGVADWDPRHIVELLRTGTAPRGAVMGPMADVVYRSTQHLSEEDLAAMATYLKHLPRSAPLPAPASTAAQPPATARDPAIMARGARLYAQHCAYCHGDAGEGANGAYPALAGSRAVNMASPINLVQIVRRGGFLPATTGNPRPYGMPPFGPVLNDAEIAAVLTYIRGSWGNDAPAVNWGETLQR